jgi:hypothetical protein
MGNAMHEPLRVHVVSSGEDGGTLPLAQADMTELAELA